ncbi:MAG: putative Ig domain-containing protein, partial [Prosthecobacter sp.]|nr:putative Ig domain-containing protein [Prosthecobacter sp.]
SGGCTAITLAPNTLPAAAVGTAYTQTLTADPVIGLKGEYYSGMNFNTLLLTRNDAAVNFDWGYGAPADGLPTDVFSVRWTGKVVPQTTGGYTFQITSDDGFRLWVNNVLVIDQWKDQGPTNYAALVNLTAGTEVPIKAEFYENGGGAVARLYWNGPGFTSQPLTQWQSYTWSVANGSLPAGLTLNPSTGVISGTPTSNVSQTFTVRASDPTGCSGTQIYTLAPTCPTMSITTATVADAFLGTAYSQSLAMTGGTAPITWSLASGSLPAGLSLSSAGVISGTPSATSSASFTVRATDASGCQVTRSYSMSARSLGIGNQVWVDMNNDGLRQSSESGIGGLRLELWTVGSNGTRENGGGDDVKAATDVVTDANGLYQFLNLTPGSYYVRIPTPPLNFPSVSATVVSLDNGVNNDSNAIQAGGSGAQVVSPIIVLTAGGEPAVGVDGDDTDVDSTVDFGFANLDACYVTNLFDNPSFEFQQLPNSTGTVTSVLGYNGTGTALGTGVNAYQWVGGTNGTSGLGEPIQRVQVLAGNTGSKVAWVDSVKSRHGRRYLLLDGTGSSVSLRAAGGAGWSSVLQAGREYQISVWAANASAAAAAMQWNLGADASIFQVISGSTPGLFQNYTVSQGEMTATAVGEQQCCGFPVTGTSLPAFSAADYNNWSEAVSNGVQPAWRQFTWRFRIATAATAAQIDTANFVFSGGSSTGPIVADYVSLCNVSPTSTLTIGNLVWNDVNNNGVRDGSELGLSGVTVELYTTTNSVAGDGDDVKVGTTTTSASGAYTFTALPAGKYVVKVTPLSNLPVTGGTPVTLDNGVNNDNNGSQPGGPGTPLYSPVIDLAIGAESMTDGDTDPDTELSVDFALWSGFTLGNLVWADTNGDGTYQSSTENGISGVTVELLNGSTNAVLGSTTTNSSGIYTFSIYKNGTYRVRIPTPPSSYPLITGVNNLTDNGQDNDSNGIQSGGVGMAMISPLITLAAATEPGSSGATNIDNTIDFGFRNCPSLTISPTTLTTAMQYAGYSASLSATGGTGPYTWTVSAGSLPAGLTLSSAGVLSGTPNAAALPGLYDFTLRAADATNCTATRSYTLMLLCPVITVAPPTLPGGTQYAFYSQQISASGGTDPYVWSVSPALPAGVVDWWPAENGPGDALGTNPSIALNGLAYTDGSIGAAFDFDGVDDVVEVTDAAALKPAQITVEAWVNPATSGLTTNGVVVTKTTGTAGTDGYGLAQLGNASTFGFWVNDRAGNRVTATLIPGVWSHVVGTYDGTTMRLYVNGGQVSSRSYSTAINHSTAAFRMGNNGGSTYAWKGGVDEVVLYNRSLTALEVLTRYSQTISGNNGLPDGLELDSDTGLLSGSPTSAPGTYNFIARASDENGCPGVRAYALSISCPAITINPTTLPAATQATAYSTQTLEAGGGTAPFVWSLTEGALPTGMTLSSAGALSGTPTSTPGTYNFTVEARDANNCAATRAYAFTVNCPTISLSSTTFANAQQFVAYTSQTVTASGGNTSYTYAIQSGALPTGMSLSSAGTVSGTPSAIPGTYNFTVRATDALNCTGTRAYSLVVTCPAFAISPTSLPAATQQSAYSQTLTATGGNAAYTWTLTSGSLPTGLSLSSAGVISGTATSAPGVYDFTVRATDAQTCVASRSYSLTLSCPAVAVTPTTLTSATAGAAYSQALTATGGTGPYAWTVQSGALPAGVTLSGAGSLSGTPTGAGAFNFVARAVDANGCAGVRSYTLTVVCPTITVTPSSLSSVTTGAAFNQTLTAAGGKSPYTWVVQSGSLPTGLTLSTAGVISGNATSAQGDYSFTVAATDGNACVGTRGYVLTLTCPTVLITTATLPNGATGTAYSQALAASAGTSPYTWSLVTGTLPTGLSLSSAGVISGVPTQAVTRTFTVQARDAYTCTSTKELTLTTVCPTLTLTPASLTDGYRGVAYSRTLGTTGGTSPYTYTLQTGELPAGLTLSSAGVISGTPTVPGLATFSVRSTDASGCQVTANLTLMIQGLSLGDLVWNDTNQNGIRDGGELGISGVSLELFSSTDTVVGNGDDVSVGTTITDTNGAYAFTGLAAGRYYVKITTVPTAQPYSSGAQVNADNGVNNDNNGLQPSGKGTVVTSPMVQLSGGREPGDVASGGDVDNTLDFAFRAVPVPGSVLLEYNLNTASGGLPSGPSLKDESIVNGAKIQIENGMNGLLDQSDTSANGPILDGALSRRMRDWDVGYDSSYDAPRTSLTQLPDSVWVRFDMDPTATGTIGNLDLDVKRVSTGAPTQGKAFLTWSDGANYYTAVSTTFTVDSASAWYSVNVGWSSFLGGATALPTGADLAGKSFLLEVYFWGGDGSGYVDLDNVILEGDASISGATLSMGDLVWKDLNCDGVKDPNEPGLGGLSLELWRAGTDGLANTGDDTLYGSTVTDANGYYLFKGLPAGKYFVKVPTPDAAWPLASPADTQDNGEDNDNNGTRLSGIGSLVYSPVIDLTLGKEPGNLASGGNQDMTVDFGFCASLSIGNLVWSDNDNDGQVDSGENGVSGAQLELYSSTDTTVNNGDDVKVGSTFTTDETGEYNFSGLAAGRYYIKLTPPSTHPRVSSVSTSADNGVNNDNNGITQASDGAAIYSMMVNLAALTEPGNLLAPFGSNAETTVDFGLRPILTQLGNLVFKDGNNNNRYDDGEGVGNVRVELLNANGVFLQYTTTNNTGSNRGTYQFTNLLPGNYYVRIPASEFASGKSLANTLSLSPASPVDDALDDDQANGDSGVDNANPSVYGITSPRLTLADNAQPINAAGESGFRYTLDDDDDDNGNMTVDFGFKAAGPSETGCYHFVLGDANHDELLDGITEWTPDQPYNFNYTANVAHMDLFDMVYDAALKRLAVDASFTQVSGRKVDALWLLVSTGSNPATSQHAIIYVDGFNRNAPQFSIYRYDETLGYASWQTAGNLMVSSASGSATKADVLQNKVTEDGSTVRFQFVLDVSRVNNAANWSSLGINSGTWEGLLMGGGAGTVLHTVDLASAPTYAANGAITAFDYTPSITTEGVFETDPAGVFTIITEPCSVSPWVSVGNLVWSDTNNNGLKDSNELGVSGATVQLFSPGADNTIGGTGLDADVQVGSSIVTSSSGAYNFTNLVPGKYYVKVTPPASFPASGGVAVTLDNGVNNDNNGSQPGGPGTALYSPIIDLAVNAEPAALVDGDGLSGDATVDFGLWSGFSIGDIVWSDLNNNGLKDSGESGVSGVTVELMNPGTDNAIGGTAANADTVLQTTTTNSSGIYGFRSYSSGAHYIRVTPTSSLSLASDVVVTLDNGVNNDNNGTQTAGAGSVIHSMIFNLGAATEPGSTGATNTETTIDFGLRGCPAISITPTSLGLVTQASTYSQGLAASGGSTPYSWNISSGSL